MADLADLRAKITLQTQCALQAQSRATGREISEIVRDVLDIWAGERIHESNLLTQALEREGLTGQAREGGG